MSVASARTRRSFSAPVARFGAVGAGRWRAAGDPGCVGEVQGRGEQPRVFVPLHGVEGVAGHVLARDEPGGVVAAEPFSPPMPSPCR